MGATNENSNFDLRVSRVKSLKTLHVSEYFITADFSKLRYNECQNKLVISRALFLLWNRVNQNHS